MPVEDWRPAAPVYHLRLRAAVNAELRRFFAGRGVLEVETPVLSCAANVDPNIEPLFLDMPASVPSKSNRRYLRTSPEFALKRLLAAGVGDCYELGRVFRAGECGRRHNPEFTMLEWYRVGWDHHRLMAETADLVLTCLALVGGEASIRRVSYRQLFLQTTGLDPFEASHAQLCHALDGYGIVAEDIGRDDWLDLLLTHRIQPAFPADRITLLYDYPASQCALARLRQEGGYAVAERFELFLGPLELANGYHELTDATEQRRRFLVEAGRRAARGQIIPPRDERLLKALESGLPGCAGVALGVDRLLMAMARSADIAQVVAFPAGRA